MARVPHPLLKSIGSTIRAFRLEQGLSQEVLADLAHIDRSYMSSIERGLRNISVLNMARIAAALHVPMSDLIYGRKVPAARAGLVLVPTPVRPASAEARLREDVVTEWEPGRYLSLG